MLVFNSFVPHIYFSILLSFYDRKTKGGDAQEQLIYQIIEEAGNKGLHKLLLQSHHKFIWNYFSGIWIREIRTKSNLSLTTVNKLVKSLETKKVIKAVKSVSVSCWLFLSFELQIIMGFGFSGI
jgi:predicted transcriptional regulator